MTLRVYHYTSLPAWERIEETGKLEPRTALLKPHWRNVPKAAHRPHLFTLFEPAPPTWCESRRLETLLQYIVRNAPATPSPDLPIALVEIQLEAHDDAHVVAFDHFDTLDARARADRTVPKMVHQAKAVRAYYASRVPLRAYDGSYRLPEVIISHSLPLSRARLVASKPAHELL